MEELGFAVAGVFGPGPLEAAQITKLSPVAASLLVDNWHNEAGLPAAGDDERCPFGIAH